MRLFGFLRVVFGTAQRLRANTQRADALAALPMPDLIEAWVASLNIPELWNTSLRAPVMGAVAEAEARLGAPLPAQLAEFYELSDGVKTQDAEHPYPFVGAAALARTSSYVPPLSQQIEAQWREWGEADGLPRALRICPPGYMAALTDRCEREVEFEFVDDLIALQPPDGGRCICIVLTQRGDYPPGTVFEVENITATRYESLSRWIATTISHVQST